MPEPKRVLVVDDDDVIRETVAEALALEGYEVATATNGIDALEHLRTSHLDVVLIDLMMPMMNGWEFLKACREQKLCNGTAVLVMSAYRRLGEEAPNLGARACIAKPFDLEVLLGAVDRLARRAA